MTRPGQVSEAQGAAQTLLDTLHEVPREWWQYVGCGYCRAKRQEPCVQAGINWPGPARQPHSQREQDGFLLHHTLWMLVNFPGDVLGPTEEPS